jgi:hypothetical protein
MRTRNGSRRDAMLVHAKQHLSTTTGPRCDELLLPRMPAKNITETTSASALDLATKSITLYFVSRLLFHA